MKSQKNKRLVRIIILDLIMIIVLLINLLWIIIDAIYAMEFVQLFLQQQAPIVIRYYQPVHQDFWKYDLIFVAFFVTEIVIQWAIAIYQKTYHRWFFYPFVHWYDVLGSIPVGGLRWLRVLRIISIVFRLQKLQIIDITKNYVFQIINKYLNVLVEEISDRVVINVLEGVQEEAKSGTPVVSRILDEVIKPQKNLIVEIIATKVQDVTQQTNSNYNSQLNTYIDQKVSRAIELNQDIALLKKVPVVGPTLTNTLEQAVGDVVFKVINGIINDLSAKKNSPKLHEIASNMFDQLIDLDYLTDNKVVEKMLIDSIDIIKDQVNVQQWKIKDIEEREKRLKQKLKHQKNQKLEEELNRLEEQKQQAQIATPLFKTNPEYEFENENTNDTKNN